MIARRAAIRVWAGPSARADLSFEFTVGFRPQCAARWDRQRLKGGSAMPKIEVDDITMNYEQQGTGEPLLLIPYLAADNACYAFQVGDYAKHFTCISVDPRG